MKRVPVQRRSVRCPIVGCLAVAAMLHPSALASAQGSVSPPLFADPASVTVHDGGEPAYRLLDVDLGEVARRLAADDSGDLELFDGTVITIERRALFSAPLLTPDVNGIDTLKWRGVGADGTGVGQASLTLRRARTGGEWTVTGGIVLSGHVLPIRMEGRRVRIGRMFEYGDDVADPRSAAARRWEAFGRVAGSPLVGGLVGWAVFNREGPGRRVKTTGLVGPMVGALTALVVMGATGDRRKRSRPRSGR